MLVLMALSIYEHMEFKIYCKRLSGMWRLCLAVAFPVGSQGVLSPHVPILMGEAEKNSNVIEDGQNPRSAAEASPGVMKHH